MWFIKNIGTFLNTEVEWHSFVLGWSEIICPWHPYFPLDAQSCVEDEPHYYTFGRAVGMLTWVGIISLLVLLLRT